MDHGRFRAGEAKTWRNSGALSREHGGEDEEREEQRGERWMSGKGGGPREEEGERRSRVRLPKYHSLSLSLYFYSKLPRNWYRYLN